MSGLHKAIGDMLAFKGCPSCVEKFHHRCWAHSDNVSQVLADITGDFQISLVTSLCSSVGQAVEMNPLHLSEELAF